MDNTLNTVPELLARKEIAKTPQLGIVKQAEHVRQVVGNRVRSIWVGVSGVLWRPPCG
jgi:hypothetical protein